MSVALLRMGGTVAYGDKLRRLLRALGILQERTKAGSDMRSILIVIGIVLGTVCPVAIGQSLGKPSNQASANERAPADDLEFTGFAKERQLLDDPYEFASTEARQLWEHVLRVSRGTSEIFADLLKQGGDYAPLGRQCFLVRYAAIQFTCLGSFDVQELTPWNPPGNTEVLASRALPDGGWWAIVLTRNLSRGVNSESYHALFGGNRAGAPFASSQTLVSSVSAYSEEGRLCEPGSSETVRIASRIETEDIESGSDSDRVGFRVLRSDCRTGRTTRVLLRYRVSSTGVRQIR